MMDSRDDGPLMKSDPHEFRPVFAKWLRTGVRSLFERHIAHDDDSGRIFSAMRWP